MMVADSDVLIDYLRGREPGFSRIRLEVDTGRLCTTAINAFELLSGAKKARELAKVEALLGALRILSVDEPSAASAAQVRRQLEGIGEGIGSADCMIAGVCLTHGATLLTRNRNHFERVPGLRLGIELR